MMIDWVSVDGRDLKLSRHVVERYVDRAVPHLPYNDALAHLVTLIRSVGTVQAEPPPWLHSKPDGSYTETPDGFVMLGPSIALPVSGDLILTVLVQGGVSDATRERRREQRRDKARRRKTKPPRTSTAKVRRRLGEELVA